jgi:hypothetical protein
LCKLVPVLPHNRLALLSCAPTGCARTLVLAVEQTV